MSGTGPLLFLVGGSRADIEGLETATATGAHRREIGGAMKAYIGIAMLVTLTVGRTIAIAAQEPKPTVNQSKPAARAVASDDNMAVYRQLAAETLAAFQAHDMSTARKKARELEVTWDTRAKALQKKSPDLWGQIDRAMDAFIKPVMQGKSHEAAKVQTAYDTYIVKLQLAETKRT
jgi:hypothetical protein